jgi:hypothetical protein
MRCIAGDEGNFGKFFRGNDKNPRTRRKDLEGHARKKRREKNTHTTGWGRFINCRAVDECPAFLLCLTVGGIREQNAMFLNAECVKLIDNAEVNELTEFTGVRESRCALIRIGTCEGVDIEGAHFDGAGAGCGWSGCYNVPERCCVERSRARAPSDRSLEYFGWSPVRR